VSERSGARATLEEELLGLEKRLLDPKERRERRALAELLDEDFVEHGSSGRVYTRAEILALPMEPDRAFEFGPFRVKELAPGCALARYRVLSDGVWSLRCSVWRLREGRWQLVFHQGTACPGE